MGKGWDRVGWDRKEVGQRGVFSVKYNVKFLTADS